MLKSSLFALALLLAVAPASAQTQMDQGDQMMMMKMQGGKSPSEADKGYMEAMHKMHEAMMKMEMTGDPTGDFVRMMIPHHQSAIDMAMLVPDRAAHQELKDLAKSVIQSQGDEINKMNGWLGSWYSL